MTRRVERVSADGATITGRRTRAATPRRRRCATCASGRSSSTSRSSCAPARSSASCALEGQGQDELFEVLVGRPGRSAASLLVDGAEVALPPSRRRHPRRARVRARQPRRRRSCLQRSVRENIALPFSRAAATLGPHRHARRAANASDGAIERLQIDTRAQGEVRRLSGGNQQKVTIARWIAGACARCSASTRPAASTSAPSAQIYHLLRELADAGAAVLLYTSELEEVQLACDRAVVIFGGRVVEEMPAAVADEPTLLRAAYGLPPGTSHPSRYAEELRPSGTRRK